MTTTLIVLLAGSAAIAQPTSLPAPIPTPVVPGGNDQYGAPFLAPGAFPATLYSGLVELDSFPGGYVLDGANSNYVRQPYNPVAGAFPLGGEFVGESNEGDLDTNVGINPTLLDPMNPRSAFAFPNTNWDVRTPGQINTIRAGGGEIGYGWAITGAAGVTLVTVANNGRDNLATDFGTPVGTLYSIAHATPNSFRSGRGYNMLTGQFSGGNGSVFLSFQAVGFPTEYIVDIAPAFFPFLEGWVAGCTSSHNPPTFASQTTANDPVTGMPVSWPSRSPVLPADAADIITPAGNGLMQGTIDFTQAGLDISPESAMLFMQSASDSNNDNIYNLIEAGAGWQFAGRKDESIDDTGATGFATNTEGGYNFVALPYDTANLVGGKINANGTVSAGQSAGAFTIAADTANPGRYFLTITGVTGEDGMLLLQDVGGILVGDTLLPGRTFLSYDFDANNNRYVIESRQVVPGSNLYGEAYPLTATDFYVAYISFSNPPAPEADCPADFNGDTTPGDIFDLFDFLAALDGGLDFNGDTSPADIFDLFDFLAVLDAGCP